MLWWLYGNWCITNRINMLMWLCLFWWMFHCLYVCFLNLTLTLIFCVFMCVPYLFFCLLFATLTLSFSLPLRNKIHRLLLYLWMLVCRTLICDFCDAYIKKPRGITMETKINGRTNERTNEQKYLYVRLYIHPSTTEMMNGSLTTLPMNEQGRHKRRHAII